ncbi:hypothetical protein HMPREF0620_0151 [Parascardovia denticolens DSM 10105 = JCM 12538]|uniref:PA domain protein n=2 Tax=Parascardovia denticolens TaxID=78258 RepID=E6JZD1_PARDN|nr:hypothetical protein HMPREF9017_00208 [Parascardovia denticolens F0305]EFT83146.1 hypothetical protein HMPREF0620_0151 [Parascardovia denticolens DSM 10105 = JCM 12538]
MRAQRKNLSVFLAATVAVGTFASVPFTGMQAFAADDLPGSQAAQVAQVSGRTARSAKAGGKQLLGKVTANQAVQAAINGQDDSTTQAIRAQLAARKIDYSKLSKVQQENTYVDVVVRMTAAPASTNGSVKANYSSTAEIEQATDKVIAAQAGVKKAVQAVTGQAAGESYGYVINGFSTKVQVKNLARVRQVPGVQSVTVQKVFYPLEANANSMANVQAVWSAYKYKGEGTVVAVIDTGIDPNHKDMRLSKSTVVKLKKSDVARFIKQAKHGKYFTEKVPYGFNYADNNTIITDTTVDEQHGMHVAGIIGANGTGSDPATSVVGVAPESQLLAMKVFTNSNTSSTTGTTTIVAAVEDSAKIGADVLNMSLGSTSGNQGLQDPEQQAVQNANDSGTAAVISAGNAGTTGSSTEGVNKDYYGLPDNETVGNPGTSRGATTVASGENTKVTTMAATITDGDFQLGPQAVKLSDNKYASAFDRKQFAVVTDASGNLSLGSPGDFTDAVKGKIAIVRRGSLTFTAKQANAKTAGAAGLIIVNNQDTDVPLTSISLSADFPTFGLSGVSGRKLVEWVKAHPNDTFGVAIKLSLLPNAKYSVDRMSDFTSYGPVSDLSFKPDITAPGGNIWSTQNNNGYTNLSGTSMASPFVAGSQAILKQAINNKKNAFYEAYYKNLKGSQLTDFIKAIEMNTAQPINDEAYNNVIVSPRRQGAGLVDVKAAIDALENNPSTVVSENGYPAVELKSFTTTRKTFKLVFTNRTKKTLVYTMDSNEDTDGVYTSAIDPKNGVLYDAKIAGASIKSGKRSIKVKAGKTVKVTFTLTLPKTFDQDQYVEGFLNFKGNDGSRLNIPYLGFFGDWAGLDIVDAINGVTFDGTVGNYGTIPLLTNASNGSQYYGGLTQDAKGNLKVDVSHLAFSTNPDATFNAISMQYYLLRNVHDVKVEILDAKGKSVTTLSTSAEETKSYYYSNGQRFVYFHPPSWDGSYYDQATGKTVKAADGKYVYRISAAPEGSAKRQSYDVSFTLDSQAPQVRNIDLAAKTENGATSYYLTAETKDDLSGLDAKRNAGTAINQVVNNDASYTVTGTTADGYSQIEIPLTPAQAKTLGDGDNIVELYLTDNASNVFDDVVTAQKPESVVYSLVLSKGGLPGSITQLTSGYRGGVSGGSFVFTGTYPARVYGTYTNADGKMRNLTVSYDPQSHLFAASLPLEAKDYETTVTLYTNAARTKVLKKMTAKVRLQAPVFSDLTVNGGEDETSEQKVEVKGKVSSDAVMVVLRSSGSFSTVRAQIADDGSFSAEVPVIYGDNSVTVTATDADGNQTSVRKSVSSSYDPDVLKNAVSFDNGITFGENEVGLTSRFYDAKTGIATITGKVKHPTTTLKIDGKDVDINDDLTFSVQLKLGQAGRKVFSVIYGDSSQEKVVQDTLVFELDSVPPTLSLKNPTDKEVNVNKAQYRIRGTATDNLNYLQLFINGSSVKNQYADIDMNSGQPGKMDIDETVNLLQGKNVITVTVSDFGGNKVTKVVTVNYTPKKALNKPNVTASLANSGRVVKLNAAAGASGAAAQTVRFSSDDGATYRDLPAEGVQVAANGTYFFKTVDAAGNESEAVSYQVTSVKPTADGSPAASQEQKDLLSASEVRARQLVATGKYDSASVSKVQAALAAAQSAAAAPQASNDALAAAQRNLDSAVNGAVIKLNDEDRSFTLDEIAALRSVSGDPQAGAGLLAQANAGTVTAQEADFQLRALANAKLNLAQQKVQQDASALAGASGSAKATAQQQAKRATDARNSGLAAVDVAGKLSALQQVRKAEWIVSSAADAAKANPNAGKRVPASSLGVIFKAGKASRNARNAQVKKRAEKNKGAARSSAKESAANRAPSSSRKPAFKKSAAGLDKVPASASSVDPSGTADDADKAGDAKDARVLGSARAGQDSSAAASREARTVKDKSAAQAVNASGATGAVRKADAATTATATNPSSREGLLALVVISVSVAFVSAVTTLSVVLRMKRQAQK